MPGIHRLIGTVKHFDWGGNSFIPGLLNKKNPTAKPIAEYWLGTHSQDECKIILPGGREELLKEYLAVNPQLLGASVQKEFDQLPYLLKVLDVKKMLSIQVHPSRDAAKLEFERENREGIPLHASQRNYKDPNHKPELMVACSEFWLLHGFKTAGEMKKVLKIVPELNFLLKVFNDENYAALYRLVMEMPQEEVNKLLAPLVERIVPLYKDGRLNKKQESFWAARASILFDQPGKIDRGIFSIYLFNLLQLKEGEGIFQPAGVPHAYLEGQNVEIMASSDNVLRGGLTLKHIDVPELLKNTRCEPTTPVVLYGNKREKEIVFDPGVPDFILSRVELQTSDTYKFTARTAEILLLLRGTVNVTNAEENLKLHRGEPALICFPGHNIQVIAEEPSLVFKASVPRH